MVTTNTPLLGDNTRADKPSGNAKTTGGIVAGVWAVLSLLCFVFIYRCGLNVPLTDEWLDIVPFLTGEKPVNPTTLWAQFHQHRIFATRAFLLPLLHFGGSFRLAMAINAVLLIAAVGFLLYTIARVRGRLIWTDVIVPLLLLNWGHYENFLWAFQVQFIWSVAVVLAIMAHILDEARSLSTRNTIVIGCLLLTLPLFGASGLIFLPFLTLWYVLTRFKATSSEKIIVDVPVSKPAGSKNTNGRVISIVFVCLVGVLLGLYGCHYSTVGSEAQSASSIASTVPVSGGQTAAGDINPHPSPVAIVHAATYFCNLGFGITAKPGFRGFLRPFSALLTLGIPLLYLGVAVLLVAKMRQRSADSLRAFGLFGVLAGVVIEALAVGFLAVKGAGGGKSFDNGIQDRYALLSALGLVAAYLAVSFFVPHAPAGRKAGRFAVVALALFALFYTPLNFYFGYRTGVDRARFGKALASDLSSGKATPVEIISRYGESMYADYIGRQYLAHEMDALRRVGVHPFDTLAPEPMLKAVPLATTAEPANAPEAVPPLPGIKNETALVQRILSRPNVYGIRLTFEDALPASGGIVHVYRLYWKGTNGAYTSEDSRPFSLRGANSRLTITLYPGEPVDTFTVQYLKPLDDTSADTKIDLHLVTAEAMQRVGETK